MDWDIDCVVPVPDGARPTAIQISSVLGLPYREGLVKNRYVGRTFIMPDQVLLAFHQPIATMPVQSPYNKGAMGSFLTPRLRFALANLAATGVFMYRDTCSGTGLGPLHGRFLGNDT